MAHKKKAHMQEKKFAHVMKEGYENKLHAGSKKGPVVKNPEQMKAIAAAESGMTKKKK